MDEFCAFHVVTDRPMQVGQHIMFDSAHLSGVYQRVMDKADMVQEIYAHPEEYDAGTLEHHTAVALRELALEEVRRREFPDTPSRLSCLYVSDTAEEAEKWAELFVQWQRPTYHIVKLAIRGNRFIGDANNCFNATLNKEENLRLAQRYWRNEPSPSGEPPIRELLVDGDITVINIVREINKNLP